MRAAVEAGRRIQTSVAIASEPNTTVTQTVEPPKNDHATPKPMSSVSTTGLRLHRLQCHKPYAHAPSVTAYSMKNAVVVIPRASLS